MIEVRPTEYISGVDPKPKILLPNHWIKFSDKYPDSLDHVKGKTMVIEKNTQVYWKQSVIVKEACYIDMNLSNENGQEYLYPENGENLYEILIGMQPGNWYIIPYFPADQPIYRLDYPTMTPTMSDTELKYLGAIYPQDSPASNPTFKLYTVYKLKPVILRIVADDGVDYEKCRLEFCINRCLMREGTPPLEVKQAKPIKYLDELKW